MSALALTLLLAQGPAAAANGAEMRSLTVTLVDDKGQEVADVAFVENGVHRDIASFKRDDRPLVVAVLVDSSAATASAYRLNVVDAVLALIGRLPSGTRYA